MQKPRIPVLSASSLSALTSAAAAKLDVLQALSCAAADEGIAVDKQVAEGDGMTYPDVSQDTIPLNGMAATKSKHRERGHPPQHSQPLGN